MGIHSAVFSNCALQKSATKFVLKIDKMSVQVKVLFALLLCFMVMCSMVGTTWRIPCSSISDCPPFHYGLGLLTGAVILTGDIVIAHPRKQLCPQSCATPKCHSSDDCAPGHYSTSDVYHPILHSG